MANCVGPLYFASEDLIVSPVAGIANGTTTISNMTSTTGLVAGQPIEGPGVPAGTIIAPPQPTATSLTLSNSVPSLAPDSNLLFMADRKAHHQYRG